MTGCFSYTVIYTGWSSAPAMYAIHSIRPISRLWINVKIHDDDLEERDKNICVVYEHKSGFRRPIVPVQLLLIYASQ